ncbi:MAG: alpha-amylase family glycosyl hydrolase [Bacteroidales bacterium]|nr:alpha-amylase family glycosyl hydrolase [Bacteroidales bacterium]
MKTKISRRVLSLLTMLLLGVTAMQAAFVGGRTDFRDESIYFVMTTRFYDGDPSNNAQCWDAPASMHGDPAWRGDFKGLIEKLDYIKALGFTAIWITPVVENASGFDYHGYHASNFSKVDHRYESEDVSFQTLIDEAHARGMKIILDIVLNHCGNFGEDYLCKQFTRNWEGNQYLIDACMVPATKSKGGQLPDNYVDMIPKEQYDTRLALMKNTDNQNHDTHNYWHHFGQFNWDDNTRWYAQIAGDCVDLNTENPATAEYLINCYGSFIKMGVDGFRIDTGGHIPRLTFNKMFVPRFHAIAEQYKDKRGGTPFFMYTEVCARYQGTVTYRNQPALSPYFYTWKENKEYDWNYDASYWDTKEIYEKTDLNTLDNIKSCEQQYADNCHETANAMPTSNNALLNGNEYHKPDTSMYSGLSIIDFPVHYAFHNIGSVWSTCINGDKYYNDATYNVVYVDSHDYSPGPNDGYRFNEGTAQWAENLDFMFTFRGIPCLYYGSEIEFRKGAVIDKGPLMALNETGRAYYGGYITGDVAVNDFADVASADGNVAATLNAPLVRHLQRLHKIRAAVPALRKGQYSIDGCKASGGYAFKRRYTDDNVDSYALVTINSGATFTGVLNGTYTDCVTGDVKVVTDGTLTTTACSGQGNMRVYVLSTEKTPAPGKVGEDGKFIFTSTPAADLPQNYDGHEEDLSSNDGEHNGTGGGGGDDPVVLERYTPSCEQDDKSVFYEAPLSTFKVTTWVWDAANNYTGGKWPGQSMQLMGVNADSTRKIFKWTYQGTLTAMPKNIIFVANGTQTENLDYKNHGYYVEGVWSKEITNYVAGAPTVAADKESGRYEGSVTVTLTASDPEAIIVYTTDGKTPTAESAQAKGSKQLTFTDNTKLNAGVLHEGRVRNVITREYIFHDVEPTTATIYLKDPMAAPNNWNKLYFYAWDASKLIADTWPGLAITDTKIVKGDKFYYRTFNIPELDYVFNIIFNQGDGSHQTVDITGLKKDTYFEIASTTNKYTVNDITAQYASKPGDVNGDGKVDVSDVTALVNKILGQATYSDDVCDITGDGKVDVSDVTALINIILVLG